ncbi:STAS domain-containing protein (plasmid) [Rhodobacteraceae bacterium SC52]|nr:STAS domain-containing protein [Rhodobacteraceae bacterium SC52]
MIQSDIHQNGICVVVPGTERLTAATAGDFKSEVSKLVDGGHDRLIIDLSKVTFVDSSGLGALVGVLKKVGNRGEIVVCAPSDSVAQMFRITRMDRVFATYPNVADALKTLEGQG